MCRSDSNYRRRPQSRSVTCAVLFLMQAVTLLPLRLLQHVKAGAVPISKSGPTNVHCWGCATVAPLVLVSGYRCCCHSQSLRFSTLVGSTNDKCRPDSIHHRPQTRSVKRLVLFFVQTLTPLFAIVSACGDWCFSNPKSWENKCTWPGMCDACPTCLGQCVPLLLGTY